MKQATLYKTQHFTEAQIRAVRESANRQQKIIARWFWHNRGKSIGATHLHNAEGYAWPITSTRRTLTNLKDAQILVKTGQMVESLYGKPESLWKWRQNAPVEQGVLL